ncbi:glycosyltransferase [Vibrio cyclitrophicus]
MKIVHICIGFPIEFPGGITNYVASLSRIQGVNNDVVVYSGMNDANLNDVTEGRFTNKRYQPTLRTFSLDILAKDEGYIKFFNELIEEDADVYHFHSVLGLDLRFIDLVANNHNKINYFTSFHDYNMLCPRVYMVDKWNDICHAVDIEKCKSCIGVFEQVELLQKVSEKIGVNLPTIKSNSILKRDLVFGAFLRNAKANIAVSKRVKSIYEFYEGIEIDVQTIGNDSAKEFKKRHYKELDKIRVAFLGSFNEKKGAKVFIELCKSVTKNVEFVVYGRGDKELLEEFERAGGQYKGAYTPEILPTILESVHIGCVLSIWEDNGPQVTMELINNGIPTIGTNRGGIPDFISPATGLIIEPTEINKAGEWLESLDISKLNTLCANIKPLKTPEEHSFELLNTYSKVLD